MAISQNTRTSPAATTPAAIARARLLSDLPDETLEALVEAAIDVLDRRAGDCDVEQEIEGDDFEDQILGRNWHHPAVPGDAVELHPLDSAPLPVTLLLTPEGRV